MKNKQGFFFTKGMTTWEKTLILFSVLAVLLFAYVALSAAMLIFANMQLPKLPGGNMTNIIIVFLASFTCFSYLRGWKMALVSLVFLCVVCWAAEALSIHTGIPFGNYYYTLNFPGPRILDTPVLLGFFYFAYYLFPAYFMSNLLVDGTIFTKKSDGWKRTLFVAFVASVIIAGIDMLADPTAVTTLQKWVWTDNSFTAHYGIPLRNYLGYLVLMTPVMFLLKQYEIKHKAKPMGPITIGMIGIPLSLYFVMFILNVLIGPAGLFLIGCFTMMLPLVLSIDRLWTYFKNPKKTMTG